jgi:hypothetical protein
MGKTIHFTALLVLVSFVLIASTLMISRGVCCGDDGAFASLAKNLAWGYGYASSVGYHSSIFSLKLFDYTVQTTGPTLIFPTAFAIRLLGNQYWVPGATHIVIWLTLLFVIYRILCSATESKRTSAAAIIFLILIYAVSPYHFEQWCALLGEVPSILFVILGFVLWAIDPFSKRRLAEASLLIGLGVMTKLLSLIYLATFAASVFFWNLSNDKADKVRSGLTDLFWISGFCFLPLACFELWKFFVLGFADYTDNTLLFFENVREQGLINKPLTIEQLTERSQNFYSRFGVSISEMLLLGLASVYLAFKVGGDWLRRLAVVSFAGTFVHSIYWLFFSVGLPRYLYSGLVFMCFIASIPFLVINKKILAIYLLLIALLLTGVIWRTKLLDGVLWPTNYPILVPDTWFTAASERKNQQFVTEFLDARYERRPFVTFWGGSVANLEYLLRGVVNFTGYQGLKSQDYEKGFLLIKNTEFDIYKYGGSEEQQFKSLIANCGLPLLIAEPFTIYDCKPADTANGNL